jgi:hypothetical protein
VIVLHYFVFLKPVHISFLLIFDCLHTPKLAQIAFIPTHPNNSWNNLSAIRFTVGMVHSQCLSVYAVSLLPRTLRQTEALRTMPSDLTRRADF